MSDETCSNITDSASGKAGAQTSPSTLSVLRDKINKGERGPEGTRQAILLATERLLRVATLSELNVSHIIDKARVSRPTFYSYFESKSDVVCALRQRLVPGWVHAAAPLYDRPLDMSPAQGMELALSRLASFWSTHGGILAAVVEGRYTVPRLRDTPPELMAIDARASRQLDRDRAMGLALPNPPDAATIQAFIWGTEQVMYRASRHVDPDLPDVHATVPGPTRMWCEALYPSDGATASGARTSSPRRTTPGPFTEA